MGKKIIFYIFIALIGLVLGVFLHNFFYPGSLKEESASFYHRVVGGGELPEMGDGSFFRDADVPGDWEFVNGTKTFTPYTETTWLEKSERGNDIYKKMVYYIPEFIKKDDKLVNKREAKSLKGYYEPKRLVDDGIGEIIYEDWNWTSVSFRVKLKGVPTALSRTNMDIPIKKEGVIQEHVNLKSLETLSDVISISFDDGIVGKNWSYGLSSITDTVVGVTANASFRDATLKGGADFADNFGSYNTILLLGKCGGPTTCFYVSYFDVAEFVPPATILNFSWIIYNSARSGTWASTHLEIYEITQNWTDDYLNSAPGNVSLASPEPGYESSAGDAIWSTGSDPTKVLKAEVIGVTLFYAKRPWYNANEYETFDFANQTGDYVVPQRWLDNRSSNTGWGTNQSGDEDGGIFAHSLENTNPPQYFIKYEVANIAPVCNQTDTNISISEDSGVWYLDANMTYIPDLVNISCWDNDDDALTYAEISETGSGGLFTNPNNDDLIFTTSANATGTRIVTYNVSDGLGESTLVSAQTIVTAVEDNPWFDPIPNNTHYIEKDVSNQNVTVGWRDYWHDVEDTSPAGWSAYSNNTDCSCWHNATSDDLICNPAAGTSGNMIIILSAEDSGGVNATVSFEIFIDQPPTIPNMIAPDNETETDNETIYLICNGSTDPDGDALDYQFYVDTSNPPTTLISDISSATAAWNITVIGDYWWRCRACDLYNFCSGYNDTRSISVDFENIHWIEENYTNNQTGTGRYDYEVNVTYNDIRFSDISATVNISNQTYSLNEQVINSTVSRFYTTLSALQSWETLTNALFWNFSLQYRNDTGQYYYNDTYEGSVYVNLANFTYCADTANLVYVNFTFKNENNDSILTASIPSGSNFIYSVDSGQTVTKTYSYSEIGENYSYAFCFLPPTEDVYTDIKLYYNSPGYIQRLYQTDATKLTNVTTNTVLYLVSSSEGSYTTFQVVNEATQALEDVLVKSQRLIGGTWTIIESKYTDDAGGATFFVDPDQNYRFIFSKSGYTSQTLSITPTQSSYTVTMSSIAVVPAENYAQGISYVIEPSVNVLENDTDYNFNFTINSSYFSLDLAGFVLNNGSGTNIGSASCSVSTGCMASLNAATGSHESFVMDYYWLTNSTYMNGSTSWSITRIYKGEASLAMLPGDIKRLGKTFDRQADFEFTKALVAFFLVMVSVLSFCYFSGVHSPLAIVGSGFTAVLVLDQVDLVPTVGWVSVPFLINHFIAIVVGIIFLGVIIYEFNTR